jgi:hypothetical protein
MDGKNPGNTIISTTLLDNKCCYVDKNVWVMAVSKMGSLAEEYEKTLKRLEEIRGQLADSVIKALIKGPAGPKDCTELAVSTRLGMPRSTVRNVMQELSSEDILEVQDLVTIKPYKVRSLVKALEKGYVSFTLEEFHDIFAVGQIGEESWIWGDPFVGDRVRGELVQRFLSPSQRSSIRGLLAQFHEFRGEDTLWDRLVEAYGEDELKEIWLMSPEQAIINDAIQGRRRFSDEWIPSVGEIEPPDVSPKEAREILTTTILTKTGNLLKLAEEFADQAEKKGFAKLVEELPKTKGNKLLKESVWAIALALRYAAKLGATIGVDNQIIARCSKTADRLEALTKAGSPKRSAN